jgi:ribA/ribD-fused uncharacterized protein
MIQMQTALMVADNSGAKKVKMIMPIGGSTSKIASIGDKIKINRALWEQQRDNVMKKALFCKFTQNRFPRDILLQRGTKTLAEANGRDLYWGTGTPLSPDNVLKPDIWKGSNCLDLLLMELRQQLMTN